LLVLAGGVTVGALCGVPGIVLWTAGVATAALPGRGSWIALAIVAAIGAGLGCARVAMDATPPVSSTVLESDAAEVVVRSMPQSGPSGPRVVVRVERVLVDGTGWVEATADVLVLFRDHAPDGVGKGDRLRLRWSVTAADEGSFGRFVRSSGAGASASVFAVDVLSRGNSPTTIASRLRDLVTRRIMGAIPGDGGALLAGFVTGDDSGLSASAREAFERTGTSHITAVSGSNVAVLLTMWFFFMPTGRLRRSLPALVGVTLVVWLYVLLVGLGPGAVRAGLMATIMLPAARLGRRPDPLTALLLASAAMLLIQPDFADSVGFWLSLAAATAIVTCIDRRASGRKELLVSGATALLAAQVATLPIVAWTFGGWSPASIIANLLLGPLVSAVFPLAFVVALVITAFPWLGPMIGWLPAIAAEVILAIVRRIAERAAMLRIGVATPSTIALLGILSLSVIAVLSVDARRWLHRVAWRLPHIERLAPAAALGAGIGAWLVVVLLVVIG
jgi:competence protein ComEC